MFQLLDDHGVRDIHPNWRSLNIIGKRHEIVPQDIPISNATIPDITDIPDGIRVNEKSVNVCNNILDNTPQSNLTSLDARNKMTFHMIIDILNATILTGSPIDSSTIDGIISDPLYQIKNLSFKSIIAKYTLDQLLLRLWLVHLSLNHYKLRNQRGC